ncbi:CmpA/NrtA family ABC transporter substrate-binding protein [Bosea sp. BIWAKO-01]|uniref:CmpA/NrtA family ABC transporter substrate-binding protein n=1 Tax=Bosea sp. BIWAKO-01 TaxID=506668 RepID=UPI000853CB35|nr:CmpA/NrtA family ABC transporter substrate-binding protein [Bosea sp. BIWAKO-01]GAU80708.1 nitrate ABC transporter nitrate-binding protein [Bosea sp. BIWAKO-01]
MTKTIQTRALSLASGSSRREMLNLSGAAALASAIKLAFPSGAMAQGTGPEVKGTRLGYIALTDSAPLIIAKEKGFYAKHGVPDMEIAKQASWGATRDNMALGTKANGIDGGHILRPKTHLYTTGKVMQNSQPLPMYTLLNLNEDGQAISVSNEYKDLNVQKDASPLKQAFERKRAAGKELTAAMTFPGGTHDLWIRYWLAAGGIDPDTDIKVIVVPPPQMVANMKVGTMDCFCVGEPWNEQLVNQNIGYSALTTGELWFKHPEKILGMRADWVDANPKATQAILMAVMEAQMWCEKMENRQELSEIVGRRQWFNVPVADLNKRLQGDINYGNGREVKGTNLYMKFWGEGGATSYPWKSLDTWFVTENIRWGKFDPTIDIKALVDKTNRADLWREAAKTLGVTGAPTTDSRGVETFFDGMKFDPAAPLDYLKALKIKRVA